MKTTTPTAASAILKVPYRSRSINKTAEPMAQAVKQTNATAEAMSIRRSGRAPRVYAASGTARALGRQR